MKGVNNQRIALCHCIVKNKEEAGKVTTVIAYLLEPTVTFAIQEAVFEVTSERVKTTGERVMNRRR
jgi:hypothetical protein